MARIHSTNNSLWLTLEGLIGSGDEAAVEKAFKANKEKLLQVFDHASFRPPRCVLSVRDGAGATTQSFHRSPAAVSAGMFRLLVSC